MFGYLSCSPGSHSRKHAVGQCPCSMQVGNAYTVLLREKKLPMSLLEDPEKKSGKASRVHLLQTQPFQSTFGQKQNRKRPRLAADSYSQLRQSAEAGTDK